MRVVVTGASGGIGRALIPRLCALPDVSHIVGVDRVRLASSNPKLSFHVADMRDTSIGPLFASADVVIHLAFAITQGGMTSQEMRDNNVLGSLNVFRACRANNVHRLVNLSSASVYGSGEQLDESAPLTPSKHFPYACQKAELETIANEQFADIDMVHLRSTFVLGPNAVPFLRRMCTSRVYVTPRQPYPRIQVVHEEDVAAAIVAALHPGAGAGVFNIAAPEAVTIPELIRNGRSLMLGIPLGLVDRMIGSPQEEGNVRPVDTALELLRGTLTLTCKRALSILRWTPRYSAWEARASCEQISPNP